MRFRENKYYRGSYGFPFCLSKARFGGYTLAMEKLVLNTKNTILKHGLIPGGTGVLAGVSGGADSVALLCALNEIKQELGFELYAAHLNHGIRGAEADGDQAYVKELCDGLGVQLYEETLDIPAVAKAQGKTLEQAAREQRYAFFERALEKLGARRIAVAHHMEDQAESIMLHLIRGSGLKGLTGMEYMRGNIIRPFLDLHRGDIENYLAAKGLTYRTDSTNLDRDASRNRLRLDVMPYIAEHINPGVTDALCSMAELLKQDEKYLDDMAREALNKAAVKGGYDRTELMLQPKPILSRALRLALNREGVYADIERKHIEMLFSLLAAATGSSIDLPHISAWVSYDRICFGRRQEKEDMETYFRFPGKTLCGKGIFFADEFKGDIIKSNLVGYMDGGKLPFETKVRTRREGDVFRPYGAPGSKKLKAVMIDRKIPREEREKPGIFLGNELLFMPGLGISDKVKVTADTRRIIRVQYTEI